MAKTKRGRIITITSMKGGVGKTATTLLLAAIYENLGKKVLLLDLDLYAGSIAFSLNANVKYSIYNVSDDIANNRFKGITNGEYLCHYDDYIDILASPKDPRQASKIDKNCIEVLLNTLSSYYDVILIDTNHILDMHNMIAFEYSDRILNVFTNDALDLKGTKTFISICKNIGVDNLVLALNNAFDNRKNYFSNYDIKGVIKANIDYVIPASLYIKNYDSYVVDGTLLKTLLRLKSTSRKGYAEVEKLALKLLEVSKKEELRNEEK